MEKRDAGAAKRRFKDAVYGAVSRVPAALANAHRLELLDLVSQAPRSVQELAAEAHLTVANASQHLVALARLGLVTVERRGTFKLYQAADPAVYRLLVALRAVAESVAPSISDLERPYRTDTPPLATAEQALGLLEQPGSALLDVRPAAEYGVAHLPGAISVPLEALRAREVDLPKAVRYLVYCRGPYCVFADEAVVLLQERGLEAKRLSLGPVEWVAGGGEIRRVG